MRLIFAVALIASANASSGVTGEYIKVQFHDSVAATTPSTKIADVTAGAANAGNCSLNKFSEILVRVPAETYANQAAVDAIESSLSTRGDLVGACINLVAATSLPIFATQAEATAVSLFFIKTTTNTYMGVQSAVANCTGALTVKTTGFLMVTNTDCGGAITGANQDDGLQMIANAGFNATGTLYSGRHVAIQLQGPFSNSTCTAWEAAKLGSYPLVIPTEDATANSMTVASVSTSDHCVDFGDTLTAANHHILGYKLGGTKGDLLLTMNQNATGITFTTADMTCTPKVTGATIYHSLKVSIGLRGTVGYCMQSSTTDGGAGDTGKYFRLQINPAHLGYFPNEVDVPSASPGSPGSACSSAVGLRVSATMAAMIALIGMMM